jgi:predicted nucleic acid-binding protein
MEQFAQIIRNALEYLDKNNQENYDVVRKFKYYTVDNQKSIIIFYDKNKKRILSSKYEIIGKYILDTNVWIWGWAISEISKNLINISRKVLNYALDLDKNMTELKSELITSRYRITSPIQIDIHTAISAYLSKQKYIVKINYEINNNNIKQDEDMIRIKHRINNGITYLICLENLDIIK